MKSIINILFFVILSQVVLSKAVIDITLEKRYGESCSYNGASGTCMNPSNCNGDVYSGLCPGGNDNKCCIPKADDSKCTSIGGQCMNPSSCGGTVQSGLCPGGNDNKCCIPNPPSTDDSKCTSIGGQCMNPGSCSGTVQSGLCPGGNDNKCCVPNPPPSSDDSQCTSVGGQCMNPISCGGTVQSGLCPGGSDNKCCIPDGTGNSLADKIGIIYNYIVSNVAGATKNGIAAVLGNWEVESGIEPKRAEADYVNPPIGAPSKSDPCWDDDAWLSMTGPEIYNGRFPAILKRGLGLGQWTDTDGSPRHTLLLDYAAAKGMKWYDLSLQLDFMLHGDNDYNIRVLNGVLTSSESVDVLTERFLRNWEGNGGDKLAERKASANNMYSYLVEHF